MRRDELSDLIVRDVRSSARTYSAAGSGQHIDGRVCWAAILKIEGKTVYHFDGQTLVSDAHHPVLLGAGSRYTWECVEAGDFLVVNFDCDRPGNALFGFDLPDNTVFLKNFLRIEKNRAASPAARKLADKQCLYAILSGLMSAQAPPYVDSGKQERLAPAVAYLTQQYSDRDICVGRLAALCGISEVYFRKLFTDTFGVPPMRYLQKLRIAKAKEMLRGDHGSVGEIAESVGYPDIYQFSKIFRREVGLPPSRYGK